MRRKDMLVTEDELHAYMDGELPEDRRRAVEAWLATHAEDAADVSAWRLQAEAIRARYGAVADEPIPPKLRFDRISYASRSWKISASAAVIAAFLLGGLGGWMVRDRHGIQPSEIERLTAQALSAHDVYTVEVRHPVEVGASETEHLQQWLSKRVSHVVKVPNLEKHGLRFVGGRLLAMANGVPAAFLMYETPTGQRFTISAARTETADTPLRYNADERADAIYWVDGKFAHVVTGAGERQQLWQVAREAYEQTEQRPSQEERGL